MPNKDPETKYGKFTVWPRPEADMWWLAGILEGEGSFYRTAASVGPCIGLGMNDEDIIMRVAKLLGVSYQCVRLPGKKPRYQFQIKGWSRAGVAMATLRPYMGERRRKQIDAALSVGS